MPLRSRPPAADPLAGAAPPEASPRAASNASLDAPLDEWPPAESPPRPACAAREPGRRRARLGPREWAAIAVGLMTAAAPLVHAIAKLVETVRQ